MILISSNMLYIIHIHAQLIPAAPNMSLDIKDLEELYNNHHGWLRGWLRKHLGCSETAADLAQDTFLRVMQKESTSKPDRPRAYLSTIARGFMLNHWRRQSLEQAYLKQLALLPEPVSMANWSFKPGLGVELFHDKAFSN